MEISILDDILKSQMEFNGFVVGDWNGHGQLPECEDELPRGI